jgi:outer membrane protein assembly factor BamB
VDSTPAVAGGTVYIGNDSGRVYALDAVHGGLRWIAPTGWEVFGRPAVVGRTGYVGSNSRRGVFALDTARGHADWAHPTGGGVQTGITAADGRIFFGSLAAMSQSPGIW